MENVVIKDDMTKEGKVAKPPMIVFFVLATLFPLVALFPLVLIWNQISTVEFILGELFFLLMACYFMYVYLYASKYKVSITKEKIILKTLFKYIEIETKDIKTFSCKRYRKSEFYQFHIFTNNKKTLINTRFKDELEELLNNTKIT